MTDISAIKPKHDGYISQTDTERAHSAYADHYGYEKTPSGNAGIALLERAAHAARELGPFPDRVDGLIGQLGLIAIALMTKPPSDSAADLEMLDKVVRK